MTDRPYRDREWLKEKYVDEGLTQKEIAELANCTDATISNWVRKFDMETRETLAVEERFWRKVDKGQPSDCWEWTAACDPSGYGVIRVNGENVLAHRFSYELANGQTGLAWVLHHCDNPPCVNPDHLYLGTHEDNMQDAVERDRMAKGEKQWRSKLTEGGVREIRARYPGENLYELADEFGVSRSCIGKITRGETWTHVD